MKISKSTNAASQVTQLVRNLKRLLACVILLTALTAPAWAAGKTNEMATGVDVNSLLEQGRKLHLNYIIESAIMSVKLDSVLSANTPRTDLVTMTYTIVALNQTTNFDEEFNSVPDSHAEVVREPGSLAESAYTENQPGKKAWNVPLNLAPGARQSIRTSAQYIYRTGVSDRRTIREFPDLHPNENVFCYPNMEDVIGELTIQIESPIVFKTPHQGDSLMVDASDPASQKRIRKRPELMPSNAAKTSPSVLKFTWKNIMPGMVLELKAAR